MPNVKRKRVHKWGYFTLEVFAEHQEVVLTRKSGSREEHLFMLIRGFRHIAKQFLKHDPTKR